MINMQPVASSNVESIGFNPETGELRIKFTHGGTYSYQNVTPEKYQALMASPSKGKHVHTHIKGSHAHSKVAD